jgi:hypothetical protein
MLPIESIQRRLVNEANLPVWIPLTEVVRSCIGWGPQYTRCLGTLSFVYTRERQAYRLTAFTPEGVLHVLGTSETLQGLLTSIEPLSVSFGAPVYEGM